MSNGLSSEAQYESEQNSFVLIALLHKNPDLVPGKFDSKHLKDIHAYIFQDTPEHKPGETRSNEDNWFKDRILEDEINSNGETIKKQNHKVPYLAKGIDKELNKTLKNINIKEFSNLSQIDFVDKLTDLYSKLDHIHSFYEGNSRTLRTFTTMIANKCGYDLDWNTTNVTAQSRNELYVARDLEVYQKAFPGLDANFLKKHDFKDNLEYTMAFHCYKVQETLKPINKPLKDIIKQSINKQPHLQKTIAYYKKEPVVQGQSTCSQDMTLKKNNLEL